MKIKKGQIYMQNLKPSFQILIAGKKGQKWNTKVLTQKPGIFNGSHTMAEYTLRKRFTLCE